MNQRTISRFVGNYGMAAVLLLLCAYYSYATLQRQNLTGHRGAEACFKQIVKSNAPPKNILIVAGNAPQDAEFSQDLTRRLGAAGVPTITTAGGEPRLARQALQSMLDSGHPPAIIAATEECSIWLPNVLQRLPQLSSTPIVTPGTTLWPTFLQSDNLLNVANQIVVIAIIAVGMTMVIITGGIDLSVGSLVALSAVVTGLLIRDHAGANASAPTLIICSLAAILA